MMASRGSGAIRATTGGRSRLRFEGRADLSRSGRHLLPEFISATLSAKEPSKVAANHFGGGYHVRLDTPSRAIDGFFHRSRSRRTGLRPDQTEMGACLRDRRALSHRSAV